MLLQWKEGKKKRIPPSLRNACLFLAWIGTAMLLVWSENLPGFFLFCCLTGVALPLLGLWQAGRKIFQRPFRNLRRFRKRKKKKQEN